MSKGKVVGQGDFHLKTKLATTHTGLASTPGQGLCCFSLSNWTFPLVAVLRAPQSFTVVQFKKDHGKGNETKGPGVTLTARSHQVPGIGGWWHINKSFKRWRIENICIKFYKVKEIRDRILAFWKTIFDKKKKKFPQTF